METFTFKLSEQLVEDQRRMMRYMPFVLPFIIFFFFWFTPSLRRIWIVLPPLVSFGIFVLIALFVIVFKGLFTIVGAQQMAGLRQVEVTLESEGLVRRRGESREFFPYAEIERFIIVKEPRGGINHIKLATSKDRLVLFRLTEMERLAALLDERLNPQVYRKTEQLRVNWSHPTVLFLTPIVTLMLMSGFNSLFGGSMVGVSLFGMPFLLLAGFYFPLFRPISRTWGSSYRWRENLVGVVAITTAIISVLIFRRFLGQDILNHPCYFVAQTFQNSGCVKRIETGDFVAFVPDEAAVVVSDMQTVWFQPIGSNPFYRARPLRHGDFVQGFALAANGERLVSWTFGGLDEVVSLWDASERRLLHEEAVGNVEQVIIAPEGDYLGIDMVRNAVWLWQTEPWQPVQVFTETKGIAFSPDGVLMATLPFGEDVLVRLWRTEALTEVRSLPFPGEESRSWGEYVAFSPDGRWLAAATRDYAIHVWQVADGSLQYTWQVSDDSWETFLGGVTTPPTFSPTGDILAIGFSANDGQNSVQLWSLGDNTLLKTIPLGDTLSNVPQTLAFSSDGAFLAVATLREVMVFEMVKLLP